MRVLIVAEPISPSMGSERVLSATVKWLRRFGVVVGVVDPRGEWPPWVMDGVDVVHFFNSGSSCKASLRFLEGVVGVPKVVTVTYWPPTVGEIRMAERVMKLNAEQAALIMQGRAAKDLTLFKICELADALIFTSKREEEAFLLAADSFGFEFRGRRAIIENAVDPDEIQGVKVEKEPGFCVTVGRVEVAKNQWQVIQVLRVIREEFPSVRYACVGMDSLGLKGKVRDSFVEFKGEVEPGEALGILGRAEVHILASFRDTPGLASLEAGALGCKLVVSDDPYGTARDYFPEDLVSFVDPLSEASIYRGVREALLRKADVRLRELILERYTYPVVVRKLVDLYNSVR